jgi:hypothetical protein
MGNKILHHEQCYVNECTDEALLSISQIFCEENCNTCSKRKRIKTCHKHKIGHYYICPKTKAIKSNYYYKDMLAANISPELNIIEPDCHTLLYNIREDYVYDYGYNTYPPFRFKYCCSDVYLKEPCFSDNLLYDLTPNYTLNKLRKNSQFYIMILPKDIFEIIACLISNARFFGLSYN